MNTRHVTRIFPALVLGLFAGAVAAQQPEQGTKPPAPAAPKAAPAAPAAPAKVAPAGPARGSELVDLKVVDASGKTLASIEDLVVQESGELTAVVKRESGGLVCVPMSALQARMKKADADKDKPAATPEVDVFVYTADAAQLAAAETISSADALDAATLARCREHAAAKPAGTSDKPAAPQEGKGKGSEPPGTADKPTAMASANQIWCLKKLVGTDVKDSVGENVGDVKDVAIDLGRGQLAYVVISTGGVMGVGDKLHGVALSRMLRAADGKSLSLPVSKDSLKALKGFDLDHLPTTPDLSTGATGDLVKPASTDAIS
jgi:sporulation protein YlmC with PRC-barrel domain